MGLRERMEVSTGGPDGGPTWGDEGDGFTLQNHASVTASGTANLLPVQTITQPNTMLPNGQTQVDYLTPGTSIQSLFGAQITPTTTSGASFSAATNLTLALTVYRTLKLGAALTNGVAITSLPLAYPLLSPMVSGATVVLTNASGTQTATLSAAAAAGSTSLAINSLTPSSTYAVASTFAVTQVGNGPCFGWLYNTGGGFTGFSGQNGTPQLAAQASVLMPSIGSNTALVTPVNGTGSFLPVAAGDVIVCLLQTSSSTVVLPIANIQPLLV